MDQHWEVIVEPRPGCGPRRVDQHDTKEEAQDQHARLRGNSYYNNVQVRGPYPGKAVK